MCCADMSTHVIETLKMLEVSVYNLATPLEGLTMPEDVRFQQLGMLTANLTRGLAA